jgi:hypothetical protein
MHLISIFNWRACFIPVSFVGLLWLRLWFYWQSHSNDFIERPAAPLRLVESQTSVYADIDSDGLFQLFSTNLYELKYQLSMYFASEI